MSSRRAIVERIWQLFNQLDTDPEVRRGSDIENEVLSLFDPEIEFIQPAIQVDTGIFHGREELREIWDDWLTTWVEHRSQIEEIVEQGDRLLVLSRERLLATDGMKVENRGGAIFTFRGELIVRWDAFMDHESARRAFEHG